MNVSVIVITWNKSAILTRALAEIPRHHPRIGEVLLIDNGSSDGTVTAVATQFPFIKVIRLHRNLGVTAARNVGAINATGDVLFFLDDDGRFNFDCLDVLLSKMEAEPDVAAVGGVVHHFAADDIFSMHVPGHVPPTTCFAVVPAFKGGCAFVRRSAFLAVGLFPDYFFYGCEELDLGYRFFRSGHSILQLNQAVLLHQKEINATRNRQHYYFRYRNRWFQIWRNLPFQAAVGRSLQTAAAGLVGSVLTGCFGAYVRGMLSGIAGLPRVLANERQPMSRSRYAEFVSRFEGHHSLGARMRRFLADVRFRGGREQQSTL